MMVCIHKTGQYTFLFNGAKITFFLCKIKEMFKKNNIQSAANRAINLKTCYKT